MEGSAFSLQIFSAYRARLFNPNPNPKNGISVFFVSLRGSRLKKDLFQTSPNKLVWGTKTPATQWTTPCGPRYMMHIYTAKIMQRKKKREGNSDETGLRIVGMACRGRCPPFLFFRGLLAWKPSQGTDLLEVNIERDLGALRRG